jgi:cobalt/nickel transport system permease protein
MKSKYKSWWVAAILLVGLALPEPALAMHISEGILPLSWALSWYVLAALFVGRGMVVIKRRVLRFPQYKPLLGLMGAAVFVISCLPIPVPVVGSCSHPCGTGLAAILIGPLASIVVSAVALLIQALFLAHGGLSTLGGNILSMGVAGSLVGWITYVGLRRLKLPLAAAAFVAGCLADWATYAATAGELALGLAEPGSAGKLFATICLAFVPTQLPLGILEGAITMGVVVFISRRRPEVIDIFAASVSPEGVSA